MTAALSPQRPRAARSFVGLVALALLAFAVALLLALGLGLGIAPAAPRVVDAGVVG